MNAPKTQEQSKAMVILIGGAVVIVLLFMFGSKLLGALDSLFGFFGKDDKATKADRDKVKKALDAKNNDAFKSRWSGAYAASKNITAKTKLRKTIADKINRASKDIYDSVGMFTDNPQQGLNAITSMDNTMEMSILATYFKASYSRDLLSWLSEHYDTKDQVADLSQMIDYVNGLPIGYAANVL